MLKDREREFEFKINGISDWILQINRNKTSRGLSSNIYLRSDVY